MLVRSRRVVLRRQARMHGRVVRTWLHRHPHFIRRTGWVFLCLLGVNIVAQLAYPAGKTLPFVSVQGLGIGGRSTADVQSYLDAQFKNATVQLKTSNKTFDTSMTAIGAKVDYLQTARDATDYTLLQRFVPLSSVVIMLTRDTSTAMRYDRSRLEEYAARVEAEGFVPAVNASVVVKGEKVSLIPAETQKAYPKATIVERIRSTHFAPKTTIDVEPTIKAAPRGAQEMSGVLEQAKRAVATPLTLAADGKTKTVEKTVIGGWLDFPEEADAKKVRMTIKAEELSGYFEKHLPTAYKAAGTTKIQVIDDREVGRVAGAAGQGVDVAQAAVLIEAALQKGEKATVSLPIVTTPAKVEYVRTYSNSDTGLRAMLNAAAGGYGISVMELGGRSAHTNGTKQFVSASTYKLYIAYAVAKEVEAGRMGWNDSFNGQTVASCFDKMIVVSDNACPQAFGRQLGWQAVENMMHSIGLSAATQLSPTNYTTPNDLALFLYKLQNGSLLSADSTTRLLDAMRRQSYTRAGIPAGAKGAAVADKVGDVDGYKHDAAIVYGPKGPYVLVVMTSGGSWAGIASVTSQIHAYLNR